MVHGCCYESGVFYGKGAGLGSQTRLGWSPVLPLTSCVILRSHLASLLFNSLICKPMVVGRKGNCSVNSETLFKCSAFVQTQWKISLVGSSVFFHCCGKLVHRIRKFTDSSRDVLKLVITSEMGWVLIVSVPGKPVNETWPWWNADSLFTQRQLWYYKGMKGMLEVSVVMEDMTSVYLCGWLFWGSKNLVQTGAKEFLNFNTSVS